MQNISAKRYQTSPRTLTFIFNNDKVLFIRNSSEKALWPNLLNGVGGHVESNETIYDSASREITEETGITDIKSLMLRGIINIEADTVKQRGVLLFIFTATTATYQLKSTNEGQPAWFDLANLPIDELVPDLNLLLPKLVALPPNVFLYGSYTYSENGTLIQNLITK